MDADLWLPKRTLLSRRELLVEDGDSPFPFSTGDFNSSGEESEDFLSTKLLVADALRGRFRPLVPGCCGWSCR